MTNTKAILFDLDGTLVDTVNLIVAGFQQVTLAHLGYQIAPAAVKATIGRPLQAVFEELHPGWGERLTASYREFNLANHDALIHPVAGVDAVLAELQARGLPLGVVTSKGQPAAEMSLRRFDLSHYFSLLVTLDDVARPKPAPDPLLLGCARFGLQPAEVTYVGDAIHDIIAARAAAMRVVAVTWGAGTAAEFAQYPPDHIISHFAELLTLLSH